MADDGKVSIGTEIDTSGAEKGIKGLSNTLNKLTKKLQSREWGNAGSAISGLGAAFSGVTKVFKSVVQTVKECSAAYKVQAGAEQALVSAAKNNPYLDSGSVTKLKAYASELQSISVYGDEQLIPMMAQLAASGRNQQEIMDIMAASVDMAASGAFSLDSAVRNLNKTFGGLSGELGESIPEIKALTEEQLKNGEAVKLLGDRYKGIAKDSATAVGSAQQLSNAWGDFKENIGKTLTQNLNPLSDKLKEIITTINDSFDRGAKAEEKYEAATGQQIDSLDDLIEAEKAAKKAHQDRLKEAMKDQKEYEALLNQQAKKNASERLSTTSEYKQYIDADKNINNAQLLLQNYEKYIQSFSSTLSVALQNAMPGEELPELYNKAIEETAQIWGKSKEELHDILIFTDQVNGLVVDGEKTLKASYEAEVKINDEKIKAAENEKATLKQQQDRINAEKEKNKVAGEAIAKYEESIRVTKEDLQLKKDAGEKVDELIEKQTEYDAIIAGLSELIDPANHITTKNAYVLEQLEKAKKLLAEIKKLKPEENEEIPDTLSDLRSKYDSQFNPLDSYESQIAELEALSKKIEEAEQKKVMAHEEAEEKMTAISEKQEDIRKQKLLDSISSYVNKVKEAVGQTTEIINNMAQMQLDIIEAQSSAEIDALEEKYNKGEISLEEYEKKKEEINKEAAQKEYQMQMWQWTANVAQATANTAAAMVSTLANEQGPAWLKIAMASLIGANAAVQTAALIASKPVRPSFSTGGFLTGNSYSGDKIPFNGNAGEAILNPAEMRNFMDLANGKGGKGMQVVINNSASNIVSATPKIDGDKLMLLIDQRVGSSMASGKYNRAMNAAQSKQSGTMYGY